MMQMLAKESTRTATFAKKNDSNIDGITDGTERNTAAATVGPTVESILPPTLHPQTTPQHQQYTKQFCEATIRNQFLLDNVLKYSGVATSQEVLRQRRAAGNGMMEWATEDQMSKIDSVMKSVARDWSAEMKEERSVVYDRLIGALEKYMPIAIVATSNKNGESNDNDMDECTSDNDLEQQQCDEPPKVAVPGSGLGRLAWEIYSRGYSCQGSDFSLPMLLASDFILNGCGIPNDDKEATAQTQNGGGKTYRQFAISPWISETKNMTSFQHRTRTVIVPDVDPTALQFNNNQYYDDDKSGEECNSLAAPEFTMMAGEFLSLYSHFLPEHQHSHDDGNGSDNCSHPKSAIKFNAVVCSFFIDTAPSIPHYLITIYHMLEDGGLFINFGPLMYHWSGHGGLIPGDLDKNDNNSTTNNQNNGASVSSMYQKRTNHLDSRYLSSIDYTWEEVRYMILQCGFEIVEEELGIPARYTSDGCSMMKVVYDCAFLVARKKPTK